MERWLKLDANFPHTRSCLRMQERFGRDGPYVWVCVLTAAKRATPEGEFVYTDPGWPELGLAKDPPAFTLDEFFRLTGQLHLTARRRSGDVSTINLRTWNGWQAAWQRDDDRQRKSRKRAETQPDTLRTQNGNAPDGTRTEKENARAGAPMDVGSKVLSEGSVVRSGSNASPLPTKSAKEKPAPKPKQRKADPLWDALVEVLHSSPQTSSERGRWNAALRELREASATPADVRSRSLAFQRRYPDAQLTPTGLSANWGSLAPPRKAEPPCPECGVGGGKHSAGCPNGTADLRAIAEGMNEHR